MRWFPFFGLALLAATLVYGRSWQAPFHIQDGREPDLVDLMVQEAKRREIVLDADLNPTDVQKQASSFTWSQCGENELAVNVESIELDPESPQRGQNLTVHGKAMLVSEVEVSVAF